MKKDTTKPDYRIVYLYEDNTYACELGFLDEGDEIPDVTKALFTDKTWCVQIGFTQPLEHELVLRPGVQNNPDQAEWPYYATYFPGAQIVSWQDAAQYMKWMTRSDDAFNHHVRDVLRYNADYAGHAVNDKNVPIEGKEDLFFVHTRAHTFCALSDNAALLMKIPENGAHMLWRVKNPFDLRHGL